MRSLNLIIIALAFGINCTALAQKPKKEIDKKFNAKEAISDFRFLASDELKGRDAARPEIDVAARYIVEQFIKAGAKALPNATSYMQPVPFRLSSPPAKGMITIGNKKYAQGEDVLILDGPAIEGIYEMIVVGYGQEKDYEGKDVKGKIVVTNVGAPNRLSPSDLFSSGREKTALAKAKGAIALIEMYNVPTLPWNIVSNFLNTPQLTIDLTKGEESLPYIWIKDLNNEQINAIGKGENTKAELAVSGKANKTFRGNNVIAIIEGTDPKLKNEYVMLSAHYDHIGVGKPDASGDSIYNGARDNAVGTVAIINAAKYFAAHPPKRSILLCAWTAEEKGLLGSKYFADNPLVPLNQIVYNLNIDNGGYNDTSVITVIGLGRTSADDLISKAVAAYGLEAIPDPAPEQGLYDRSDNVNFARKGIPSPTFSLGFRAFDDEIAKYYHQPSDQVDNFDLDYAILYWKSYLLSASSIANHPTRPIWTSGDKYEEAAKALYSY
jgi:hypothetical protein